MSQWSACLSSYYRTFTLLFFISQCPEDVTRTGMSSACVSSRSIPAWAFSFSVLNDQESKEIINHLCLNLKPHTGRRTGQSRFASPMQEELLVGNLTKQHSQEQVQQPTGHHQILLDGDVSSRRRKGEPDKLFFCYLSSGTIKCTRRCCCCPIQDSNQIFCTSLNPDESGEADITF